MDRESLKLLLAQGLSVEKIAERFGKHPSTISYWMAKHGLQAVNREKHAVKGGIERERLEELVAAGMTIAELSAAVGLAKTTVRYWLGRYGLRTCHPARLRQGDDVRQAKAAGLLTMARECPQHGLTPFVLDTRGCYRCRRCRSDAVTRRRRRVKQILIAEAGGCCQVCGYDRHPAALAFHHLDPTQKRLVVSARGAGLGLDTLRAEARKCVLLCANCHAEVESGAFALPIDSGKFEASG